MGHLATEKTLVAESGGGGGAVDRPQTDRDTRRPTPRIRLRIPRDTHAAGEARRALESLEDELSPDHLQTLRLLMTELVTNSVRHADGPRTEIVEVEVAVLAGSVRVEVGDGGSGFDALPRSEGQDPASGWGLHLVDRLSSRWGVRRTPGTSVWFEMDHLPRRAG